MLPIIDKIENGVRSNERPRACRGAPDVVEDGVEGWLFSVNDPSVAASGLRQGLEKVLHLRGNLPQMGLAARRRSEGCGWEKYRAGVLSV